MNDGICVYKIIKVVALCRTKYCKPTHFHERFIFTSLWVKTITNIFLRYTIRGMDLAKMSTIKSRKWIGLQYNTALFVDVSISGLLLTTSTIHDGDANMMSSKCYQSNIGIITMDTFKHAELGDMDIVLPSRCDGMYFFVYKCVIIYIR